MVALLRNSIIAVTLLACTGAAREPSPIGTTQTLRGCPIEVRRQQVCEDLRHARLLNGTTTEPLRLLECSATVFAAVVRWVGTTTSFDYRAVVRFDWQQLERQLVPIEVGPYQRQWPCQHECDARTEQIEVDLKPPCGRTTRSDTVRLNLTGPSERGCVWVPWLTGTAQLWCDTKLQGNRQALWIWSWHLRLGIKPMGPLVLDDDAIALRAADTWITSAEPALVENGKAALAQIWTTPPEVEEHCRDGGTVVVQALNSNGWRVISRSCSDPGGVLQLMKRIQASTSR